MQLPYYLLQRGKTEKLTVADAATLSDEVEFDHEFQSFKISPVDDTDLTAGTIGLLVNGKATYLSDGTEVEMTYSTDFVWTVHLDAPVNRLSLTLGAATTGEVVFQITGYVSEPN